MSRSLKPWPPGVVIRAARVEDAEQQTDLASLPGFRAGTLRLPYSRIEQSRHWLKALDDHSVVLMALIDERIVGNAGLNRYDGRRSHAGGIGIGVHDDFVGRGIGRALMNELLDVADNWLNLKRLELNVYADNAVAIGLYESLGFKREGVFEAYAFRNGAFVDSVAMARLRL